MKGVTLWASRKPFSWVAVPMTPYFYEGSLRMREVTRPDLPSFTRHDHFIIFFFMYRTCNHPYRGPYPVIQSTFHQHTHIAAWRLDLPRVSEYEPLSSRPSLPASLLLLIEGSGSK